MDSARSTGLDYGGSGDAEEGTRLRRRSPDTALLACSVAGASLDTGAIRREAGSGATRMVSQIVCLLIQWVMGHTDGAGAT